MRSATQSISRKNSASKAPACLVDISAIPVERLSKKELAEHRHTLTEMQKGRERRFRDILTD